MRPARYFSIIQLSNSRAIFMFNHPYIDSLSDLVRKDR